MKSAILSMFAAASLLIAGPAFSSEEMMSMLKKNNCLGCHKIEGKKVGPSYTDIAHKYKGDAHAAATLESKVAHGGNGVWGSMPMPANFPRVEMAEIKVMVAFILSLAN